MSTVTLPRCADPECRGHASTQFVSGRRFGIAGRIHSTCYARRVHRAYRKDERQSAKPRRENVVRSAEPRPELMQRHFPNPDQLDRMAPAEAVGLVLEAWGQPWAAVVLTAEPRGVEGHTIPETP